MVKKLFLILFCIILLSVNVLAEDIMVNDPIDLTEGEERTETFFKYSLNNGNIIKTLPDITENCVIKPDHKNDGLKHCTAEFEINKQEILLAGAPLGTLPIPSFNFVHSNPNLINQVTTYSTTSTNAIKTKTIANTTYNQNYNKYTNYKILPNSIDLSQPYSIKIEYDIPQYEENQFNLSIGGSLTAFIDPIQSECGTLSSPGTYTVNKNIAAPGTCITIAAEDVILDCAGNLITYGVSAQGYGIYNGGYKNVTSKNCIIVKYSKNDSANYGIYYYHAVNGTIFNNTIKTNGTNDNYGIYLSKVNSTNVSNNNITTDGSAGNNNGISLVGKQIIGNIIFNNNIETNGTSGNHGIYIESFPSEGSYDNNITFNIINTKGIGTTFGNKGIYITNSDRDLISNNIITTNGAGSNNYGIEIPSMYVENTTISFNTITTSGSSTSNYGIRIASSDGNNVSFNVITTNGTSNNYGLEFIGSSYNQIYSNNIFTKGTSSDNYGIHLETADNNYVSENNVTTGGTNNDYGIYLLETSNSNTLINNNITSSYEEIKDTTNSTYVNYLIYSNSFGQIEWLDDGIGGFLRNLTTNSNNYLGIGLGRNLFIRNNTIALNTSAFIGKINSTANITLYGLTLESVDQVRRVDYFTTNNTDIQENGINCIGTICNGVVYLNNTLTFNTTSFSSFSALVLSACGSISEPGTYVLNESVYAEGTCFTIDSSNVTLNCKGKTIDYADEGNGGYGIYSDGYSSIEIINCNIFTNNRDHSNNNGIHFKSVSNSKIFNNNITTNGTFGNNGIYLFESYANVTDNNINTDGTGENNIGITLLGENATNNIIHNNKINTGGSVGDNSGIKLTQGDNNLVKDNVIYTFGFGSSGIVLDNYTESNRFDANEITASTGILFGNFSGGGNILLNNNISTTGKYLIYDDSSNTTINNLIYNNSLGDITWIDNKFLSNLTIHVNNFQIIGHNRNIFIGDNVFAINVSAFSDNINSSAYITLYDLTLNSVSSISRLEGFNTNTVYIQNNGANCDGSTCTLLSYNNITGILKFNTTSLASFAGNQLSEVDVYQLSLLYTNSSAYAILRFFMQNIDQYDNIFNWGINTGESHILSTNATTLMGGESMFVFVEHDYSSSGQYTVNANGTTINDIDTEQIGINVG